MFHSAILCSWASLRLVALNISDTRKKALRLLSIELRRRVGLAVPSIAGRTSRSGTSSNVSSPPVAGSRLCQTPDVVNAGLLPPLRNSRNRTAFSHSASRAARVAVSTRVSTHAGGALRS